MVVIIGRFRRELDEYDRHYAGNDVNCRVKDFGQNGKTSAKISGNDLDDGYEQSCPKRRLCHRDLFAFNEFVI